MFPKEFEFKRVYENCERELEDQLLGWSRRGREPIRSPWNLQALVARFINDDLKLNKDLRCQKPPVEDLNRVANEILKPYYGALYVKIRNMWAATHANR